MHKVKQNTVYSNTNVGFMPHLESVPKSHRDNNREFLECSKRFIFHNGKVETCEHFLQSGKYPSFYAFFYNKMAAVVTASHNTQDTWADRKRKIQFKTMYDIFCRGFLIIIT